MKTKLIISLSLLSIFVGCSDDPDLNKANGEWLIPSSEIFDGGPGKDGIPSLTDPELLPVSEINYLSDDDLILGVKRNEEVLAFPHPILDWHEIINISAGSDDIAITYCPLTGTGIGWDREINGVKTTFGVSGLLYNTNLIPYDRLTDSNWSQMELRAVNGVKAGTQVETHQLLETSWKTWKTMYPNSLVVSNNTGFSRNYGRYPYGSYKSTDQLLFPISNPDNRLFSKERVLGVIVQDKVKAYRFNNFVSTHLLVDTLNNERLVLIGNPEKNYLIAFRDPVIEGNALNFEYLENQLPLIIEDQFGNKFNIFGEAISGPDKGATLNQPISFIGFWFAWATFYPEITIYGGIN